MNKELAQQLIGYYEETIILVKEKWFMIGVKDLLYQRFAQYGICLVADNIFNINIRSDKWMNSQCKEGSAFWHRPPCNLKKKKEIIKSLQIRIDILKTFEEENKNKL